MGRSDRREPAHRYVGAFFKDEGRLLLIRINERAPWAAFRRLRAILRERADSPASIGLFELEEALRSMPTPKVDERFAAELEKRLLSGTSFADVVKIHGWREPEEGDQPPSEPDRTVGLEEQKEPAKRDDSLRPIRRTKRHAPGASAITLLVG